MAALIEVKDLHRLYGDTVAVALFGRTVIGFICAALVPESASENKHHAERTMSHGHPL